MKYKSWSTKVTTQYKKSMNYLVYTEVEIEEEGIYFAALQSDFS